MEIEFFSNILKCSYRVASESQVGGASGWCPGSLQALAL